MTEIKTTHFKENDNVLCAKYHNILKKPEILAVVNNKMSNTAEPTDDNKVLESAVRLANSKTYQDIRQSVYTNFRTNAVGENEK